MNKTLAIMVTNCGTEVGDTSSAFGTRLKVYINNRYQDVLGRLTNANLFEANRTYTITTTANTAEYPMPFDFGMPIYARDTTNLQDLDIIYEQELIQRYGTVLTTTGNPQSLAIINQSTVRVQPTSATTIKVVSTSASDTSQSVFLRGISGSAEFYETVGLSGTSSGVSTNAYDVLLQVSKSASTAGPITISYVTGGGVAAVITPQATEQRYKRVRLQWVPAGEYLVDVRYKRDVQPLISDTDTPLIDIADIIELGAKADAWRTKRFFQNGADFEARYEFALDRYINERIMGGVHQFAITPYSREETY